MPGDAKAAEKESAALTALKEKYPGILEAPKPLSQFDQSITSDTAYWYDKANSSYIVYTKTPDEGWHLTGGMHADATPLQDAALKRYYAQAGKSQLLPTGVNGVYSYVPLTDDGDYDFDHRKTISSDPAVMDTELAKIKADTDLTTAQKTKILKEMGAAVNLLVKQGNLQQAQADSINAKIGPEIGLLTAQTGQASGAAASSFATADKTKVDTAQAAMGDLGFGLQQLGLSFASGSFGDPTTQEAKDAYKQAANDMSNMYHNKWLDTVNKATALDSFQQTAALQASDQGKNLAAQMNGILGIMGKAKYGNPSSLVLALLGALPGINQAMGASPVDLKDPTTLWNSPNQITPTPPKDGILGQMTGLKLPNDPTKTQVGKDDIEKIIKDTISGLTLEQAKRKAAEAAGVDHTRVPEGAGSSRVADQYGDQPQPVPTQPVDGSVPGQ